MEVMSYAIATCVECVQKLKLVAIQTQKYLQHVVDTSSRSHKLVVHLRVSSRCEDNSYKRLPPTRC